jgi:hypothetical protein
VSNPFSNVQGVPVGRVEGATISERKVNEFKLIIEDYRASGNT